MATSRSFGGRLFTTRSPIPISPDVMFSRPATIRSRVDFPHAEGPTSTTNSPSLIATSTPRMTVVAPNALRTSRIATEAIHSSLSAIYGITNVRALIRRRFDFAVAHDLAPAVDLAFEIGGRARRRALRLGVRRHAARRPALENFGVVHGLLQGAVDGIDDRLRRTCGRQHDLPEIDGQLRAVACNEARHAGELRRGVLRGDAEHFHVAGGELPDHLLGCCEEQIDVAAERVLEHRRRATIGDVRYLDAERLRQQGRGEMPGRADARMAHPRRILL